MHYLIYKITNRLDNKFYVGKHKTENKDDDYFGSGILIERAITKHGKENFVKEILFELPTEDAMNQKEADIVDEDFVARDDTYNLMVGGAGGWSFVNNNGLTNVNKTREHFSRAGKARAKHFWERYENDPEFQAAMREKSRLTALRHSFHLSFLGKTHTTETREKIRASSIGKHVGKKNGSFGTCWITDGTQNSRVKKNDPLPSGFHRGRV